VTVSQRIKHRAVESHKDGWYRTTLIRDVLNEHQSDIAGEIMWAVLMYYYTLQMVNVNSTGLSPLAHLF